MAKWITAAPGVRYRQHPTRKHGARFDRYFTLRFSVPGRGQVEEKLGWASEGWTVARAQEELIRLRQAHRTGKGPATLREERKANRLAEQQRAEEEAAQARRQKTVADLWERYSKEVVAIENKPSTAAEKTRMWQTRIKSAIGPLKINDVTEEDVGRIVRSPLRLNEVGQVIGGKAEAGNIYRLLHHMFRKAIGWKLRAKEAGNPLENVVEPKVPRRERLLTGGEIGALLKALDSAEAEQTMPPQVLAVIRAKILTGARISELLTLQWGYVRRDELELHLPDSKTGFSRRPISAATLAVLDKVGRMPGVDFVFRDTKTPARALRYRVVEQAFGRLAQKAGVENCTLHTIRHWFSTMTANSVSNQRIGMALTGHKSHAAYMNYVHGDKEQARALAEQLAALASGLAAAGSNVVDLRKGGSASPAMAPAGAAE
jgi:integrase